MDHIVTIKYDIIITQIISPSYCCILRLELISGYTIWLQKWFQLPHPKLSATRCRYLASKCNNIIVHCCQFFTMANVSHKKFIIARNIFMVYLWHTHLWYWKTWHCIRKGMWLHYGKCLQSRHCLWMVSNRLIAWLWKRDLINRFMYWSNKISDTDNT